MFFVPYNPDPNDRLGIAFQSVAALALFAVTYVLGIVSIGFPLESVATQYVEAGWALTTIRLGGACTLPFAVFAIATVLTTRLEQAPKAKPVSKE